MITIGKKEYGLSNFAVRCVAFAAMAAAGAGEAAGIEWMSALKWTSAVLYAFLLSEGIKHTTDRILYLRRMTLFCAIGEFVYDLLTYGKPSAEYLQTQGAMATLYMGFIIVLFVDYIRRHEENLFLDILLLAALGTGAYFAADRLGFMFKGFGIIIILTYYASTHVKYKKLLQIAVLLYIGFFLSSSEGMITISFSGLQYPIGAELFSLLALPFIWASGEKRGPNALVLQIVQYLSYPLVMAILWLLRAANVF